MTLEILLSFDNLFAHISQTAMTLFDSQEFCTIQNLPKLNYEQGFFCNICTNFMNFVSSSPSFVSLAVCGYTQTIFIHTFFLHNINSHVRNRNRRFNGQKIIITQMSSYSFIGGKRFQSFSPLQSSTPLTPLMHPNINRPQNLLIWQENKVFFS